MRSKLDLFFKKWYFWLKVVLLRKKWPCLFQVFGIRRITSKIKVMSKGLDAKKEAKKEPTKSLKEKRLEKKAKKDKK